MKNLALFGLLVILLVAAQFATGQTVDDIITKYVDSIGGKDKLDAVKTIYMEGSAEMMNNEVTVKITKEQGKLSRTEIEMGAGNLLRLITDKEAWMYNPMRMQTPQKLPDSAVANMQSQLDIAGPLVDYLAKGYKAELMGKDTLDGNECYKIQLISATGKESNYWIDSKTYLLVQSSQKGGGGMFGGSGGSKRNNGDTNSSSNEMIIIYKDYGAVGGVLFPHTLQVKMAGSSYSSSSTFDKIEINQPVDPKLYKPE